MRQFLTGILATLLLALMYQELTWNQYEQPAVCEEGEVLEFPDGSCTYCIGGGWITLKCKADKDPVPPFRKVPDPEPYEEVALREYKNIRIEE